MPYDWVEPEVFLEHNGRKIYHVYRNDQYQDGPRECWYSLCMCSGDEDGREAGVFDVRDLPGHAGNRSQDYMKTIIEALDSGYFDDWEHDDWPDEGAPAPAEPDPPRAAGPPRVVVVVQGGAVQSVFSDQPVNVLLKDFDNIEEGGRIDPDEFDFPCHTYTDPAEFRDQIEVDVPADQLGPEEAHDG